MKSCFVVMLATLLVLGASWFVACGLIYLVTLCFNMVFTWPLATGVWLILIIARSVFNDGHSSKK